MSCIYGRYKNLIFFIFILTKKLNLLWYSLSIDHLEYCVMFVCNRKVTLFGVYSKLSNSIESWAPLPPPPNRPTPQNVYYNIS